MSGSAGQVAGAETGADGSAPVVELTEGQIAPGQEAPPAWATKRIGEITRQARDFERQALLNAARVKELEEKLAVKPAGEAGGQPVAQPTPNAASAEEQINTRAQALASAQRFNEACNAIAAAGDAQFKDFRTSVTNFETYLGHIPPAFVEGAMETEDPARTFYELGKDMNEAARIAGLTPIRQAAAIVKFAGKLKPLKTADGEGEGKSPGAAAALPAPIRARVGTTTSSSRQGEPSMEDDSMPMADWVKRRNEQLKKR